MIIRYKAPDTHTPLHLGVLSVKSSDAAATAYFDMPSPADRLHLAPWKGLGMTI